MSKAFICLLSAAMFFLLPDYFADSGNAQIVDFVILLLIILFFLAKLPHLELLIAYSRIYKLFLIFSMYSVMILALNFIVNQNDEVFNTLLVNLYGIILLSFFSLLLLFFKKSFSAEAYYQLIIFFLFTTLIIPLAYYLLNFGINNITGRASLSFNNVNQLGFFSLVNLSVFMYTSLTAQQQKIIPQKILSLIIININLLFIFISASRSCIPAIFLYFASYATLFQTRKRKVPRIVKLLLGVVLVFAFLFLAYKLLAYISAVRINDTLAKLPEDFYQRALNGINENFSNLFYFLFGNGTYGNDSRGIFEIHNNWLSIFNQVGLFGCIFYTYINIEMMRALYKKGFIFTLPFLCYIFYSIFQYSYRTRCNWLFLAVIIVTLMREEFLKGKLCIFPSSSPPSMPKGISLTP